MSDSKAIFKALARQGWRIEHTRSGHIKCIPPDKSKPMVVCGSTPSDHRALKNFISNLRNSGAEL